MTVKLKVKLGIEVFLEKYLNALRQKHVGLITNPTGRDSNLCSTVTLLANNPNLQLVALYGPEHGLWGNTQAGECVPYCLDKPFKLPVFSLYGESKEFDGSGLKNIDELMRTFDIIDSGKDLKPSMVENVEILLFDIQDVGTRIYTYIATMAYVMQSCAANDIEFIVLDRPNPINGINIEGPILEYPQYSSFVGLYPIPVRHGMTVGELAYLFNENFLIDKANLTVVPMEGWERRLWFDETTLPWVPPSPNMPSLDTATVYPGQVFLEGTNISEGRGTAMPFNMFGAPWIDATGLTKSLNELDLPGVRFSEAWFKPHFSKFQNEGCEGAYIHVIDRAIYKPLETSLHVIQAIMHMYPGKFNFYPEYFDRIMGTAKVRKELELFRPVREILGQFDGALEDFKKFRAPFLLY